MRKLTKLLITLFVPLMAACSTISSSSEEVVDPCKDGCSVSANYICDMTCPDCGKTYKKLESENTFTKQLDEVDYKDALNSFYESITHIYQYLNEVDSSTSSEDLVKYLNKIVPYFNNLNEVYGDLMTNTKYADKAGAEVYIYGNTKYYSQYNKSLANAMNDYGVVMADLYFSPLGDILFEKDEETTEWLSEYKNQKMADDDGEEGSSQQEEDTPSRLETLYDELFAFNSRTDEASSFYNMAYEYVQLLNESRPSKYANYYYYALAKETGNDISKSKVKEYFNYFKQTGGNLCKTLRNSIDKTKYALANNLVKLYTNPGYASDPEEYLQEVVEYFMTLKNDNLNVFDVVNNAYKEGRVFYGTNNKFYSCTCSTENFGKFIVFMGKNSVDAATHVHEFGHYLDNHSESSIFNEFTSTTQEMLLFANAYNNYVSAIEGDIQAFKKIVTLTNLEYACYYALYEDIAYCLFDNFSDIDTKYMDGISLEEYPSFFEDMFTLYGFETLNLSQYYSCFVHIMDAIGYEMSYCVESLYGTNTFLDACDNYETVVNNYLGYLSCDGSKAITQDLSANGFDSPLSKNVFTSVTSKLNELIGNQ